MLIDHFALLLSLLRIKARSILLTLMVRSLQGVTLRDIGGNRNDGTADLRWHHIQFIARKSTSQQMALLCQSHSQLEDLKVFIYDSIRATTSAGLIHH